MNKFKKDTTKDIGNLAQVYLAFAINPATFNLGFGLSYDRKTKALSLVLYFAFYFAQCDLIPMKRIKPAPQVTTLLRKCPQCKNVQYDNGLMAWCELGHIYEFKLNDPRYRPE